CLSYDTSLSTRLF
nr:immunoglobulin light chain junction region [Macaca mulatta]